MYVVVKILGRSTAAAVAFILLKKLNNSVLQKVYLVWILVSSSKNKVVVSLS